MAQKLVISGLLLALSLSAAFAATAEEAAAKHHPLTDLPAGGEISTVHFFPDHPTKAFPAGDKIKVVLGIHNDGVEAYNISGIMGSLNSPTDFATYIQNFTQQLYFEMVNPGEEVSVEFGFTPNPLLPPNQFTVALTVFYEDTKGGFYSSTFFNATIDIVETPKLVDTDLIFMTLTLGAIFTLIGYWLYKQFGGSLNSLVKKPKKAATAKKVQTAADKDEWVKGTGYDLHKRAAAKKAAAAKKPAEQ